MNDTTTNLGGVRRTIVVDGCPPLEDKRAKHRNPIDFKIILPTIATLSGKFRFLLLFIHFLLRLMGRSGAFEEKGLQK